MSCFVSFFGNATDGSCKSVLRSYGQLQSFVKDPMTGEWKQNIQPIEYGVHQEKHGRGFFSAYPNESVEFEDPAFRDLKDELNFFHWAQWVQVVQTMDDVKNLLNRYPATFKSGKLNLLMVPLFYLAGPKVDELKKYMIEEGANEQERKQRLANQKRFFREMLQPDLISREQSSRIFYLSAVRENADGKKEYSFRFLPQKETRRFDPEHGQFYSPNGSDLVVLFRGWALPPNRGVIRLDEFFEHPRLTRDIERLARKFYKEGIIGSVTFNTPEGMKAVIEGCRDQNRKGQGAGGSELSHARFNPTMIQGYIDGLKTNSTYSVEVRDPSGKVIGGGFGNVHSGFFNGDSVFYPRIPKWKKDLDGNLVLKNGEKVPLYELDPLTGSEKKDEYGNPIQSTFGIEIAKIAKYFLFLKMFKAGFMFQDSEMVSEFSGGIGAVYISNDEFANLKEEAAKRGNSSNSVDWSPITMMPEPRKSN